MVSTEKEGVATLTPTECRKTTGDELEIHTELLVLFSLFSASLSFAFLLSLRSPREKNVVF